MMSFLNNRIIILFLAIFPFFSWFLKSSDNPKSNQVSINFVGDVIPHKAVLNDKNIKKKNLVNHYLTLFNSVSNILKQSDFSFVNFEAPCADDKLRCNHFRAFNFPEPFIKALNLAGFNIFNIANNHMYDCNYKGMKQTYYNLKKHSVIPCGYSIDNIPQCSVITYNKIKIGIIGVTTLINWTPSDKTGKTNVYYINDLKKVLPYIRKARDKVDFLFISIHWGKEYIREQPKLKKWAKKLLQAGADCIIGHHPHILLPLRYKKTPQGYKDVIIYSLGNFIANIGKAYKPLISSPEKGDPRRSIILNLTLEKNHKEVIIKNMKTTPIWIVNNYRAYMKGKTKKRQIFPVPLAEAVPQFLTEKQKKYEEKQIQKLLVNYLTTN